MMEKTLKLTNLEKENAGLKASLAAAKGKVVQPANKVAPVNPKATGVTTPAAQPASAASNTAKNASKTKNGK